MSKYLIHYRNKGRIIDIPPGTTSDEYGEIQKKFAAEAGGPDDYADMVRLWPDQIIAGVQYAWELASSSGAWFGFIKLPDTTDEQIEAAKAQIRRDRDVVSMSVIRIKTMI